MSDLQFRKALRGALVASLLVVSGVAAHADDAGRWEIIPATQNPVDASGNIFVFAWRLDRKTGALEMCTYDPGGWINPVTKLPAPESLNCSNPVSPR